MIVHLLRCMSSEVCRFSDAGMRRLSTRCGAAQMILAVDHALHADNT